ncbi:MAG: bifunctional folylpolyglutamate synthase/dihydrofolate synthase [Gemmatimonadales bacterium]|nr:bifunctional folylpolyglutamate synthase/dihydrofolate synthase [Gemmatimonadales bacterium]
MGLRLSTRTYRDALDFLFARTTGQWKLGLERVEAFLRTIGDPHRDLKVLHVAGTNGKGSVCASLEAVLRSRGLRVAKYTSPHLVDFRERFVVDGHLVEEGAIMAFLDRWTPTVEELGVTFFEATTAMAFQLFADAEVDVAVIETGLGGRLDATNVVTPLVAGVTGIAIDHTEWLGTTREAIAPEKAGIYKRGVPAVVGEPDEAIRRILAEEAARRGASPIRIVAEEGSAEGIEVRGSGTSFRWLTGAARHELTTGIPGRHQANNAIVALTMLDALPEALRVSPGDAAAALATVTLPGRFSRHGAWIFDVAHNPQGSVVTAETLAAIAPAGPVVALVSILGDKDWKRMIGALVPAVDHLILTNAPTAPASRAWDVDEVFRHARAEGWPVECEPDFDAALALAPSRGATVLVTGSFHTVGDAMSRLQVALTPG